MTERLDRAGLREPGGTRADISPPPRLGASPRGRGPANGRRGALHWLTLGLFGVLAFVAVGVFVVLPGWVEERSARQPAVGEALAPGPPPSSGAEPALPAASAPAALAAEPDPPRAAPAGQAALPGPPRSAPRAAPQPAAPGVAAASADPDAGAFARALAAGLASLEQGRLDAAQRSFDEALALAPGSSEVAAGLERLDAARQLAAIAAHKERAAALVATERWAEAASEYTAALGLDPALHFAQAGLAVAESRDRLRRQLDSFIARPDRLSSDEVLAAARRLLDEAQHVATRSDDAPVSLLEGQVAELRRLVAVAATTHRVVLLSDGATEVLVYGVGRLGAFERLELDLRPGTYTVVGTRDGFRDVRRQLEVPPGAALSMTIRCEERL